MRDLVPCKPGSSVGAVYNFFLNAHSAAEVFGGNMVLQQGLSPVETESDCPDFEAVCNYIDDWDMERFKKELADIALRLKFRGPNEVSIIRQALLKIEARAREWLYIRREARGSVFRGAAVIEEFPDSFNSNIMAKEGVILNEHEMKFEMRTLADWALGTLKSTHMLWLVGLSGAGKSSLAMALGKLMVDMHPELPHGTFAFICGDGLDCLGHMTKEATSENHACFCFIDCGMISDRKQLTKLELTALQDPKVAASFQARHHIAIIPAKRERIGACNFGYFEAQGLSALQDLMDMNIDSFKAKDRVDLMRTDSNVALARRAFVVVFESKDEVGVPVRDLAEVDQLRAKEMLAHAEAARARRNLRPLSALQ